MTWRQLQAQGLTHPHQTSKNELDGLRGVVQRDLADVAITALSADRRFATAYNIVLQLSKMVIACAGYRIAARPRQHETTFRAAELAIGPSISNLVAYFDTCRIKRNKVDYDLAGITSDSEADELCQKAEQYRDLVEQWINDNHPQYVS